jgi:ribosomal-protein-alanine N-acetyltransferase
MSHTGARDSAEFAAAMIRYGFEELLLHRVLAKCDPENHGSYRVMEKNGMTKEGHLRENLKIRGQYRDTLIYGFLRHEWESTG